MIADAVAEIMRSFNEGRAKALPVLVGAKHINFEGRPPRIVWVPTTFSIREPPRQLLGQRGLRGMLAQTLEVHVWGESDSHVFALLVDLADAVRTAFGDLQTLEGGEWMEHEDTSMGAAAQLNCVLLLPIAEAEPTTAEIDLVSGTIAASADGDPQLDLTLAEET